MRNELRNKFTEVNNMQYDESKNICPDCGRSCRKKKSDFMEEFNINKSKQLEKYQAKGMELKQEYKKQC